MADLDAAGDLERRTAHRARVAAQHLGCLDDAVGHEVATGDQVDDMPAGGVGTGDPAGAIDDARIDDVPDSRRLVLTQCARADVALRQQWVLGEVVFAEGLDLGRRDLGFEALHVHVAIARHTDSEGSGRAVGMTQLHHQVLQRVGRRPDTVGAPQIVAAVHQIDQRLDGGGVGRVVHLCRRRVGP